MENQSIQNQIYIIDEVDGISVQRTPNHSKHNQQHLQGKVRVSC